MAKKRKIFISYAREDRELVENIYSKLQEQGFEPWMDIKDIYPGEMWEGAIRAAIRKADFFLIFLSKHSVNRRGVLQKELRAALDSWTGMLSDDIFIIPIRLEECSVPEPLSDLQFIDFFERDGWLKLSHALQVGVNQREELREVSKEIAIERKNEPKKRLFIAMPFSPEMEDVFFYGIQRAADTTGFSCDRVDKDSYTGDILQRIKEGIDNSIAIVADLTKSNPNVYLEVGYAWGIKKPTILLIQDNHELCFDVRGQRCLKYSTIRSLEDVLTSELEALKSKGIV